MLKKFRRSGGSGDGDESGKKKSKEPAKEKAPAREKSTAKDKGKRKASEEVVTNNHGIIFRNDIQKERYTSLSSRKIYCSRYVDENTMQSLGIKDDIEWMLDNIGWIEIMNFRFPTYPRITLEFLSSLEVQFKTGLKDSGNITFRLFNVEYNWTLGQFYDCLGLSSGETRFLDNRFDSTKFWSTITSSKEPYDPSRSKATMFQNPVFRYLHRVMSKTIFGRSESDGVVRKLELYCIWAMLHRVDFNTGFHFLQNLVKISKSSTGDIVVGGLLTIIATALGCDLSGLKAVQGNTRIDLETCLAMKMISKIPSGYGFCLSNGSIFPLPHPGITVRQAENWILRAPVDGLSPSTHVPLEQIHETFTQEPSLHELSDHEAEPAPARPSFAFGGADPAYDFSEFRTALGSLHEEHSSYQRQLGEHSAMTQEQNREVRNHYARADEFYTRMDDFVNQQYVEWFKEEEFRKSMELTCQQVNALYEYHEHLGNLPQLPGFPLGTRKQKSPTPPPSKPERK